VYGVMRRISLVLIWIVVLAVAVPALATADPVQLTIQNGRVTLVAANATVRQILAEWARIGGTHIVNGERVPGGVVTLQLTNVPEKEALDLLLRTAAGYIAAPRAAGVSGGSVFDRILILPTSATPPASALRQATATPVAAPVFQQPPPPQPLAAPVFVPPGAQRVLGPDGQPVPDDQEETPGAPRPQPYVPLPPGFSEPPDARPRPPAPGGSPRVPTGVPIPGMVVPAPAQPPTGPREVQPRGPQ
jgi:hypothetical protein